MSRTGGLAVVASLLLLACGPADPGVDAGGSDGSIDAPPADGACACDDGVFCNGVEQCSPSGCVDGTPPCTAGDCDEDARACRAPCPDDDGDGHAAEECGGDDCDDDDVARFPGAIEVCDGDDEDCDPETLGTDGDGDGFVSSRCCEGSRCGEDCDDTLAGVRPGATDDCNAIDDDCDRATDEAPTLVFYRDLDGDLYGDDTMTVLRCSLPPGYALNPGDCDDASPSVRPTAPETCDGAIDHDCDDAVDEACPCTIGAMRACGDIPMATGICRRGTQTCTIASWGACEGYVGPRAEACSETLDEDEDCDGAVEEGVTRRCYPDPDGDGYAAAGATGAIRCSCSSSETDRDPATAADCAPTDAAIHPGAAEPCDGVDSDCDGAVEDADGDGHAASAAACTGGPLPRDDCRDDAALIHPGQTCFRQEPACFGTGLAPCLFRNQWTCGQPLGDQTCATGTTCATPDCLSWDFDCSGTAERAPAVGAMVCHTAPGWMCPSSPPVCSIGGGVCRPSMGASVYVTGGPLGDVACGLPVGWRSCVSQCSPGGCDAVDTDWDPMSGRSIPGWMGCR